MNRPELNRFLPSRPACSLMALLSLSLLLPLSARAAVFVTLVQGLGGMPEYDSRFNTQRTQIEKASIALAGEEQVTAFHGEEAQREAVLAHLEALSARMDEDDRLILYLIGHGSYDGHEYKFNIPGPDLSTSDLQTAMTAVPGQHHVLVNTSSTSGALLEPLADHGFLLVTATRSGNERNATEFGTYFARALGSEAADLNKNAQVSVQEAFDYTQREVTAFFENAGKLATEHAQLQGDNANRIILARLGGSTEASDDPALNALREELQAVNEDIDALQLRRSEMSNEDYSNALRRLVLRSAQLGDEIEALEADRAGPDATDTESDTTE